VSRRRAPRSPFQRLADGTKAQRVGGAGLVYNAAPIPEHTFAVAAAASTAAVISNRGSKIDQFTLASGGAQPLALTYLPVEESWNVDLNGVTAFWGTDYTISGQTLSLLSAAGALTGDKVQIQYDYLTGMPAAATEAFRYLQVADTDATDRSGTAYDDSGWATGLSAFASSSGAYPSYPAVSTEWDIHTRLWVRFDVEAPCTISGRVDNDLKVYVDGIEVDSYVHDGDAYPWTYNVTGTGEKLIALRATDRDFVKAYLSVEVT
jgi:hypothetical protein